MKGIKEDYFISICKSLYDNIAKKVNDPNYDDIGILWAVNEIIDVSSGFIKTDNEELRQSVEKVFEASRSIKNYSYQVSHNKRLMNDAGKKNNDEMLASASQSFMFSRKLLLSSYQRALTACNEVLNHKNEKQI